MYISEKHALNFAGQHNRNCVWKR